VLLTVGERLSLFFYSLRSMTSTTDCISRASELGVTMAVAFVPPPTTENLEGKQRTAAIRAFLQGSILGQKGTDGKIDFSQRLAVVAPARNDVRSDCIQIFLDDGLPEASAELLKPSQIRFGTLQDKYVILIPGAWCRMEGDRRPLPSFPLLFSDGFMRPVATKRWVVDPPSLTLGVVNADQILNTDVRSVLRRIAVAYLVPLDWAGVPAPAPNVLPSDESAGSSSQARPMPPPQARGMPPPPPPDIAPVSLEDGPRGASAPLTRIYLSGLEGFAADLDWAKVPATPLAVAIKSLRSSFTLPRPAHLMQDSDWATWVSSCEAFMGLAWSQDLLDKVARYSTAITERVKVLRLKADAQLLTPEAERVAGSRERPLGGGASRGMNFDMPAEEMPRASGQSEGGSAGFRFPSAGPPFPNASTQRPPFERAGKRSRQSVGGLDTSAFQGAEEPTDESSDDEGETAEDRRERQAAGRFDRSKKSGKAGVAETAAMAEAAASHPALASVTPTGWSLTRTADLLCESMAHQEAATAVLSKALSAARVPLRLCWGADPCEVTEAVLSVALEAAASEGFALPAHVEGEPGLRRVIAELFTSLQRIAALYNEGPGAAHGSMGRGTTHYAQQRGSMAVDVKPATDFDRTMQGAAPLGAPVLLNLATSRGKHADREAWSTRVASAGEKIATNPPLDCLRVAMADKFARARVCAELEAPLAAALMSDARAREVAAGKAAERCLRAELPTKLRKEFLDSLLSFQVDKMPKLSELAAELTFKDALGGAHKVAACHVVQAAAATRAALTNAYPELGFEGMLAMEDDFRGLLIGHVAAGVAATAATTRAAQLYAGSLRRIASVAEAFRQGQPLEGELRDLFKPPAFYSFLDEQHAANMAATEMVASLAKSGASGGYDPSGLNATLPTGTSPGKKKLNTLIGAWKSSFGEACIFHFARGHCSHAGACAKKHDSVIDPQQVTAWVAANNADTSA
jgi:uncharacterized Fe-S cluster protein YjdI